jgi:hypothetical protein
MTQKSSHAMALSGRVLLWLLLLCLIPTTSAASESSAVNCGCSMGELALQVSSMSAAQSFCSQRYPLAPVTTTLDASTSVRTITVSVSGTVAASTVIKTASTLRITVTRTAPVETIAINAGPAVLIQTQTETITDTSTKSITVAEQTETETETAKLSTVTHSYSYQREDSAVLHITSADLNRSSSQATVHLRTRKQSLATIPLRIGIARQSRLVTASAFEKKRRQIFTLSTTPLSTTAATSTTTLGKSTRGP